MIKSIHTEIKLKHNEIYTVNIGEYHMLSDLHYQKLVSALFTHQHDINAEIFNRNFDHFSRHLLSLKISVYITRQIVK